MCSLSPPLDGVDVSSPRRVLLSEAGLGTLRARLSNGEDEARVGEERRRREEGKREEGV